MLKPDEEITRRIYPWPRCIKPLGSPCKWRDAEGRCTKRVTTCPHQARQAEGK